MYGMINLAILIDVIWPAKRIEISIVLLLNAFEESIHLYFLIDPDTKMAKMFRKPSLYGARNR